MACHLGDSVELVEEALSGRTTDLDDFEIDLPSVHLKGATLNGAKLLPAILSSHLPLDLVRPGQMGHSLTAQALRICPRGTVEGSQYRRRGGAGQECES